MGESGVGKSTLLNLVAGLDRADAGSIVLDGVDLATLDDDALTALRRDADGLRLPGLPRAAVPDRRAERRAAAVADRRRGAPCRIEGRGDARGRRARRPRGRACRASSPAASCSASRSRARSCTGRGSCSPTSRPAISIPTARARCCAAARSGEGPSRRRHPRHALARGAADRRSRPDADARRICASVRPGARLTRRASRRPARSFAARSRRAACAPRLPCWRSRSASRSASPCSSSTRPRSTSSTQGVRTLSGDADLEVRGPRGGFDEALYPRGRARCPGSPSRARSSRSTRRSRGAPRRCASSASTSSAPA